MTKGFSWRKFILKWELHYPVGVFICGLPAWFFGLTGWQWAMVSFLFVLVFFICLVPWIESWLKQ